MGYLRSGTCSWRRRLVDDRSRLHCEREGLFRRLMRLAGRDDVSVVVARLSWSVGRVISADRDMRES
jgi:hypothetical protein